MEDFAPAAGVTGMYSCGPTVYAFPHLGNMRRTCSRTRCAAGLSTPKILAAMQDALREPALTPDGQRAVEDLIAARAGARQERDWLCADQIRAQLDELGVQVTNTPVDPVWHLR